VPFVIDISPVAVDIGGVAIRWYGLTLALAIVVAYVLAAREAARLHLRPGLVADGALWIGIAALVGGRLLFIAQNGVADLATHPAHIFMIWMGGLSFYGGLAAGLGAIVVLARRRGVSWRVVADVAAPAAAIGQAIGHVGCLIGGDSAGIPTDLPWAVVYRNPGAMAPLGIPLHPTQAYEAIALAGLFVVLRAVRRRLAAVPGSLTAVYLGGLALIRFLLFFLRDEPAVLLGLKTAQWIGLGILVVAAWILVTSLRATGASGLRSRLPEGSRS
jgi:phosphatidylglycerol---prolipoprotein diacylglyceryl transferase